MYRIGVRWAMMLATVLFSAWSGASRAADDASVTVESGRVAMVVDGRTVRLTDGRDILLIGLGVLQPLSGLSPQKSAPSTDRDSKQPHTDSLADSARAGLETLLLGQRIKLQFSGQDRYGRWLAHIIRSDGLWIQGAMLSQGWGWVHSLRDSRARMREMLAIEATARRDKVGIWADPAYRVFSVTTAEKAIGSFAIIEGRVHQVAVVNGTTFFNFGRHWREDFTVRIAARDRRRFESAGGSIRDYQGRQVRVRGMVESWNGPMIKIDHPERIEILDEAPLSSVLGKKGDGIKLE